MFTSDCQFYLPPLGTLAIAFRGASSFFDLSFSPHRLEGAGSEEAFFAWMGEGLGAAMASIGAFGTPFQQAVWKAVSEIPFGETVTYGDLAGCIGRPSAFRAVGTAVGANPFALVIPCHRVVPASGRVGGYYFGSEIKKGLLLWERAFRENHPALFPDFR